MGDECADDLFLKKTSRGFEEAHLIPSAFSIYCPGEG